MPMDEMQVTYLIKLLVNQAVIFFLHIIHDISVWAFIINEVKVFFLLQEVIKV